MLGEVADAVGVGEAAELLPKSDQLVCKHTNRASISLLDIERGGRLKAQFVEQRRWKWLVRRAVERVDPCHLSAANIHPVGSLI